MPKLHQENSLAGFRRAIELGIPAIELDVLLTSDCVPVVVHDNELRRLTGEHGVVAMMTWEQVSKYRLRREMPMGIDVFGDRVVVQYEREEPIARLDELLAELGGQVAINLEIKIEAGAWWRTDAGRVVGRVVLEAGLEESVIITSFDLRKLRAASQLSPRLRLGFAFDDGMLNFAGGLIDRLPRVPARLRVDDRPYANARRLLSRVVSSNLVGRLFSTHAIGAEHTLIGEQTVDRLHARGIAIGTHTLLPLGSTTGKRISPSSASSEEIRRVAELGVDWIESDDPETVMKLLDDWGYT